MLNRLWRQTFKRVDDQLGLIADRLDANAGGLADVLAAIQALDEHVSSQDAILQALTGRAGKRLATPGERGEGTRM